MVRGLNEATFTSKNVLYPRHGGTAPQIDNGTGKFTLPKSLEYDAVASVECDAGKAY